MDILATVANTIWERVWGDDLPLEDYGRAMDLAKHFLASRICQETHWGDARAGYPVAIDEYLEAHCLIPEYEGD